MRLAVTGRLDARDRSYCQAPISTALANKLRIEVDGDAYLGVAAFDTYQGWVDVICRDERGRNVLRDGTPERRRIYGDVRISLRDADAREQGALVRHGLLLA